MSKARAKAKHGPAKATYQAEREERERARGDRPTKAMPPGHLAAPAIGEVSLAGRAHVAAEERRTATRPSGRRTPAVVTEIPASLSMPAADFDVPIFSGTPENPAPATRSRRSTAPIRPEDPLISPPEPVSSPASESPVAEQSVADTPAPEAPAAAPPGVESPGVEAPGVEALGVEALGVEALGVKAPAVEPPSAGSRVPGRPAATRRPSRAAAAAAARSAALPEPEPVVAPIEELAAEASPSRRRRERVAIPEWDQPAASSDDQIRTPAGQYLIDVAHDETPRRLGESPLRIDDTARRTWRHGFDLMVRRRFEPTSPLAEISRTVNAAVQDHAVAGLPHLDAEMLVRAALGERVPIEGIDDEILISSQLLVFATIAEELALGEAELDVLVAEAENRATI